MWNHYMRPDGVRTMTFGLENFEPNAMAIESGSFIPALLINRLSEDSQMIVSFYKWEQIEHLDLTNPNMVFWADTSGVTVMKINNPSFKGWQAPLKALGLIVTNHEKLSKRMKEIVRISRFWLNQDLLMKIITIDESVAMHYDGMNLISQRHAIKMAMNIEDKQERNRMIKAIKNGKIVRVNYRHLCPQGLIKGDATIIDDKMMKKMFGKVYDLIAPDINLKNEIRTTDWSFTTMNPHHAHNQAMFDVQSASWLREWLYPRELVTATFTQVINDALGSLRAGEWPTWMTMPQEDVHGDVDQNLRYMERASDAFQMQYLRWQMFGMDLEQSASLLGMAANGFKSKLYSRLNNRNFRNEWKPMMWLPLPHAVYGHINTHEVLVMAGFKIPTGCEDKLFYHKESHSFSLPGDQFAESFERHGTWDLDDSAKFFLRKVKDEDRIVCVIVRSPNSDGEYSVHEVGMIEDFPLYHQYGEMPEIDMTAAPAYIESIVAGQNMPKLPAKAPLATKEFTLAVAEAMIEVQGHNPGVGAVANAMMVYYASQGTSPLNVVDTMGNIVDCVQQTPYKDGFVAIRDFTNSLWDQIMVGGRVDSYLHRTRVPNAVAEMLGTYEGYFTYLFNHFKVEVERYAQESRLIGFETRFNNPIPGIKDINFTSKEMELAVTWVEYAETQFELVTRNNRGNSRAAAAARSLGNQAIIQSMAAKLTTFLPKDRHRLMLAMYRYCITPGSEAGRRFGRSDRCLFAPAGRNNQSTMDIFLDALIAEGVATIPEFMQDVTFDDLIAELLDIIDGFVA